MIKLLEPAQSERWDHYVMAASDGSFFHLSAWQQVIKQAFAHDTYYYYTEQDGEITGILPLTHVNSLLFGNSLVSNAFCVYGGIVASNDEAFAALQAQAQQLARELGVDSLEMRNRQQHHPDWPHKELYVTFRKELDPYVEKNLNAIPRKQRAMVRAGIKAGLSSVIDDNVERLYRAYSESVRNLGTPVFPKKYFQILLDVFGENCEVLTIEHEGQLVASVMSFYFKGEVLPYYGGGTDAARDLKGNDFMYWEVMRRAVEKGCKIFDYGRSKVGTGSYRFKKHWGFEPEPLYYEVDLVKAKQIPEINPLNPKYRLFIAAWKRLPLPVSQLVGPWLAKDLG
ncbi:MULTISPECIES: FemAB family XrtA/PEP-CTERM system-associated protein [Methylomonas]|uniref:Peptidoglycan bridge formation protein FemAB n=2 Tax=Methylomonas TaxID=416 RepID=A0A126T1B8_9GAMM|nr:MULTISPECIES: FemAB family XrtA/PEP-CTERM system-associated protein [Methylomonas]AMK75882.1 peptidoglycan bridge formation protein FemAB [Methylomonas denitrificans]OAI01354.1 peptidoglycan bridge formation protein FemAB [Methylomonas methanica]TCV79242.1 FemAB-related protein (PEP-CTERM system-associated) [Methylomonas methanica]